ncbi:MAG: phosphoribosyltransferase, partial [Actinobacteria bacterium]|nr:phosphoribosyltransferase [Actinomycetota bacterium]
MTPEVPGGNLSPMQKAAEELESLLRDAILNGLPGCVIRGVYRTPTLEVVNRWVDVEALLRTVSTIANAADIIADRISTRGIAIPPGTVIVAMDHTPYELVAALHDRLGASHISRLYPEASKYEPPDLPDLPAGTAVVLVTDIVLSSNTVRAAISDLIKWHKNPIAVVTIVDARPHNKPLLDVLYRHIPLIGCTSVDIRETPEPDRHRIENIDPVLRRPLKSPAKAIVDPHPITSKQLLGWCTGVSDCLYMGHIDRFVGRHYTGYIDTRALLGLGSRGRKELIGQFTRIISR